MTYTKEELAEKAMDAATEVFGQDPAYYGEEGTEEFDRQLRKLGSSLKELRKMYADESNEV